VNPAYHIPSQLKIKDFLVSVTILMWRKYPKNKKIYYFHIVLHFIYCGYFRVVNLLLFVYDTVEEGMENGKKHANHIPQTDHMVQSSDYNLHCSIHQLIQLYILQKGCDT